MTALLKKLSIYQRMWLNILVVTLGMISMLMLLFMLSFQFEKLSKKVQVTEELNTQVQRLRGAEKEFVISKKLEHVESFNNYYDGLVRLLTQYRELAKDEEYLNQFEAESKRYRDRFVKLVDLQSRVGLSPTTGNYGDLRAAVHAIEASMAKQDEYELLSLVLQLRRREKDFMLRFDMKYVDKYKADIIKFESALSGKNSISNTDREEILANLENYQEKFYGLVDGILLVGLTTNDGMRGELQQAVIKVESVLNKMLTNAEDEVRVAISDVEWMATMLALFVILIVFSFLFFSNRTISQPIEAICQRIDQIRSSNDLTIRVKAEGNDEFSVMAGQIDTLLSDFQTLVSQVNRALNLLNHASSELATNAKETQQNSSNQLDETDMVATAVTEMGATIDEIAKNTENAASKANQTSENSKGGYQEVLRTKDSISGLSGKLQQVGSVVDNLEQDMGSIGSVLDVIRGIADQTNLLALNAAIEAARAGEQGRGFAVVADEVRSLAMRTQESTQEIEQIIRTLQTRTANVVELMEQCEMEGDASSKQAEQAGNLLMRITDDVAEISDMSTQIAAAIEQQSLVASEVNQNIVSIRDEANFSYDHAKSISDVSEEVSHQASDLVAVVNKFKA